MSGEAWFAAGVAAFALVGLVAWLLVVLLPNRGLPEQNLRHPGQGPGLLSDIIAGI